MSLAPLILADFNERTRRFGFFVFMLATLGMGWLAYTGQIQMAIGRSRGALNSAWIGTTMAITAGFFTTMVGFFVVKNALENDRKSGVGEVLSATSLGTLRYLVSKWIANAMILSSVLVLLMVVSGVMQVVAAEHTNIDLIALLTPMVLLGLPAVFVVAALSVVFETVPFLRGGFGNIFYFFFWTLGMVLAMEAKIQALDWHGISFVENALKAAALAATGKAPGGFSYTMGGSTLLATGVNESFVWEGIQWTPAMIGTRLAPIMIAAVLVAVSSLWFDRFDPSRKNRGRTTPGRATSEENGKHAWESAAANLSALSVEGRSRFAAMARAELRLMLARTSRWWLLGAAAMAVALLITPDVGARGVLIPATLWPVLHWSKLGMRERWYGTDQILFSTPRPIRNQMIASWLGGVALVCLTTGTWGVRTLATGDLASAAHWLAGALFVPALAICLGVWSGTARLFESLYVALWYVGIANATPALDFIGVKTENSTPERAATYGAAALVLLALAALGRKRQME